MTKPIKLIEDDFKFIHWDKYSSGPEQFELIIYGKSESGYNTIKEQILDNQEIVELYNSRFKEFYDMWHYVIQENKKLKKEVNDLMKEHTDNLYNKQKLEQIKKTTDWEGVLTRDMLGEIIKV